jgi:hypothetical protein
MQEVLVQHPLGGIGVEQPERKADHATSKDDGLVIYEL